MNYSEVLPYTKQKNRRKVSFVAPTWPIVAAICFFSSSTASYLMYVSEAFAYMGFRSDFSLSRTIASLIALFLFGLTVARTNDVASFFRLVTFLIYLCPAFVLYSAGGASQNYFSAAVIGFVVFCLTSSLTFKTTVALRTSLRMVLGICFAVACTTCLAILLLGGGIYFSLDFSTVYDFRDVAADALPAIFAYIISPVSKVILPFGMILAIQTKNRVLVASFVGVGVIMFGLTHHKSIVAIPFATLALYFGLHRFGIVRGLVALFMLISSIIAFEALYLKFSTTETVGLISTFVVRRIFLVPPLLDSFYVDFFSKNPFFYWASSRITFGLVETDYGTTAPFLIGYNFFNSDQMSANTGFIGSGYSNAGIFGITVYAATIGIVISLLNAIGRRIGAITVICASFSIIITAITTSDLITVFLTHGLVLLFVLLTLMPRQDER